MVECLSHTFWFVLVLLVAHGRADETGAEHQSGCSCNNNNDGSNTNTGHMPYFAYNMPPATHGNGGTNEDENFGAGHSKQQHNQQPPMFMPNPGYFAPHPMFMMPQWQMGGGYGPNVMKGQKGEPGVTTSELPPLVVKEGESAYPERELHVDKVDVRIKGEKGDRGLAGPRGYRGEPGPPGPPGQTVTRIESVKKDGNDERAVNNIQQDDPVSHVQSNKNRPKVAFTVALKKNHGPTQEPVTLRFEEIISNIGGGYHTESGQFQAPVSGVYVFTYHALCQHSKPMELVLKHNDKAVNSVHSRETGGYTGVSNTAVLSLTKGDNLTLVLSPGLYYVYGETGNHTTFSGYLLYPD